ncbi:unnamed protein product, partial [Phaeothamnion confervicola]
MDVWCSRGGMDVPWAVMAMLGDRFAFYGTPVFHAYKALAMGALHRMSDILFPSTEAESAAWFLIERNKRHGYDDLYVILTQIAFNKTAMAHFPRAASEAEAVLLAKALTDDMFAVDAETLDRDFIGMEVEVSDAIAYATMVYDTAAEHYGRDVHGVKVLEVAPSARHRGLDGGFHRLHGVVKAHTAAALAAAGAATAEAAAAAAAKAEQVAAMPTAGDKWKSITKHDAEVAAAAAEEAAAALAAWTPSLAQELTPAGLPELIRAYATPDQPFLPVCGDCENADFGEVLTPGYLFPHDIDGLQSDGFAFYKVVAPAHEYRGRTLRPAAHVVVLEAGGRCVVREERPSSEPPLAPGAYRPRPFYFCDGDPCGADREYCGPHALHPDASRTV